MYILRKKIPFSDFHILKDLIHKKDLYTSFPEALINENNNNSHIHESTYAAFL